MIFNKKLLKNNKYRIKIHIKSFLDLPIYTIDFAKSWRGVTMRSIQQLVRFGWEQALVGICLDSKCLHSFIDALEQEENIGRSANGRATISH